MIPRLSMRVWTQRQQTGTDPYGGGGAWVDVLVDEPAYWWVSSGQETINPQRAVAIAGEHVLLGHDVDIRAGDRIRRLVDHEGRVVFDTADAAGRVREVEHVAVERTFADATLRSTT